jgi:NTE family protein
MALTRSSIVKKARLKNAFGFLIPVETFEELQIPFSAYATDLQSGETICHNTGNLVDAVVQSGSIPGFVEPTENGERLIVDAGVSAPLPIKYINEMSDLSIGVDISRGAPKEAMKKINIIEIITRAERITSQHYTDILASTADFLFKPDVMGLHWSSFDKFDVLLQNGIEEAEANIDDLKQLIKYRKSLRYRLFHLSSN